MGVLHEAAQLPEPSERFHSVTVARRFPNPLVRDLLAAGEAASL